MNDRYHTGRKVSELLNAAYKASLAADKAALATSGPISPLDGVNLVPDVRAELQNEIEEGASTIHPADLNDPTKAEAFIRETINDLSADIARIGTEAAEQLRQLRERHGDDHDEVKRCLRIVEQRNLTHVEPLKARRDELMKLIAHVETCKEAAT